MLAFGLTIAATAFAAPDPPIAEQPKSLEERFKELEDQVKALQREQAAAKEAPQAASAPATSSDFAPEKTAFGFADFSWAPGNYGAPDHPLSWGPFTGEFRVDVPYHYSLANPMDNTIGGSSEVFRHNEFQVTQLGIGGDLYYKGMHARFQTQFGMYAMTTPRNDASPGRGQWDLANAYRYIAEAYGGYHFNVLHGLNIQAGIFMSYIGLWSYYNFDNWTYQPSYVSSNTPWFFNGARIQLYTSDKLKIEPWIVNGWQSYGKFNTAPGVGLQILWRPVHWFSLVSNNYFGTDTLGNLDRLRVHTDDSIMFKVYDNPTGAVSKVAMSLTLDAGCEWDKAPATSGVQCGNQFFLGFMAYARAWFYKDMLGLTFGGGAMMNPGRYLTLIPPINGATAFSGTPYFTAAPGDQYQAWDLQTTFDFMPVRYVTFRAEFNHRAASVPYFTGRGGVTPPGGNQGSPGSAVEGWAPDLRLTEDRFTFALMVKI